MKVKDLIKELQGLDPEMTSTFAFIVVFGLTWAAMAPYRKEFRSR